MIACERLKLNLGRVTKRFVTQGGAKPKRYVSLHRGRGIKNDKNQRYVIFGQALLQKKRLLSGIRGKTNGRNTMVD